MSRLAPPRLVVHPDPDTLAAAVGGRLAVALLDAQAERERVHLVLTGGGIGEATLRALAATPARRAIDWARLEVWWGDERFLRDGDPERNATQAWADLLEHVPIPRGQVHEMGSHSLYPDPEAAARDYTAALRQAAGDGPGPVPDFDVLLLGVGPEGHIASLFPGSPAVGDPGPVVAVHDSPKPPPTRISLTLPAIQAAREVWLVASGAEKADALARAYVGVPPKEVPAAAARGRKATRYLLDRAAAARIEEEEA